MRGGETGCFTLKDLANEGKPRKQSSEWDCVKVVLFLVQNLLTKAITLSKNSTLSISIHVCICCIGCETCV